MTTFAPALHQQIRELACRAPDAAALASFVPHTVRLTRAELERRATSIAAQLRARGVTTEVRVGVCVERSCDLIVALLAVLKAGGVMVPLDPRQPLARLEWMLHDAGLQHGVLGHDAPPVLREHLMHCLDVHAEADASAGAGAGAASRDPAGMLALVAEAAAFAAAPVHPRAAAYMIYTSGSTGVPKAVVVEHGPLAAHCAAVVAAYPMRASDRVLHFASVNFDLAHEYWLAPLLAGASLVLTDPPPVTPDAVRDRVEREGVTIAAFPPAYLRDFAAAAARAGVPPTLRILAFGGEAMPRDVFAAVRDTFPLVRMINGYGPTEAVISPLLWPLDVGVKIDAPGAEAATALPIGWPIGPRVARVAPVAVDVSAAPMADGHGEPSGGRGGERGGELLLGGLCLARGYHGRAALTAEQFIPDEAGEPGARIYRTGDRVRVPQAGLAPAAFEYLGRIDDQVQIRGVRVEPGEIAQCLRAHRDVHDAAVLGDTVAGQVRLIACAVLNAADEAPVASIQSDAPAHGDIEARLRAHLAQHLPSAWQPQRLVVLGALPYTLNGKLDREALRATLAVAPEASPRPVYRAPVGGLEHTLAAIWQRILASETAPGRDDRFAAWGGDSLALMQMQAAIRQQCQVNLQLDVLFDDPTLAELAALIAASPAGEAGFMPLAAEPARSAQTQRQAAFVDHPASYAQQRFWVLAQTRDAGSAYHIAAHWDLFGRIDAEVLERALACVIERHDAWRTTLVEDDEGIVLQRVHAHLPVPLVQHDLHDLGAVERAQAATQLAVQHASAAFDLSRGPLLRAALVRLGDSASRLMLTAHHAISDGWSSRCAFAELATAYTALHAGEAPRLPALPLQYADFSRWQRAWLAHGEREHQLGYWREALREAPGAVPLPTDRPLPQQRTLHGARRAERLSPELSRAVRELARQHQASPFMVLLAAFNAWLYRLSGATDLVVALPVANRQRSEVAPLLGLFINTVALRTRLDPLAPFSALLDQVRRTTLAAYAHQDVPFDQVFDAVAPPVRRGEDWLRVKFAQQFVFDTPVALPEASAILTPGPDVAARFDFALDFTDDPRGIELVAAWATDCLDDATAHAWLESFVMLLEAGVAQPSQRLTALRVGRAAALCGRFQAPRFTTVVEAFAHHAQARAQHPAVTDAHTGLSFAELDAASGQVAQALHQRGVVAGDAVALCLERSVPFVVALLGVLKAGAMAVPLDPAMPRERLVAAVRACAARCMLVHGARAHSSWKSLEEPAGNKHDTHDMHAVIDLAALPAQAGATPLMPLPNPAQAAYLIYTSGSTGIPKGVVIEHRALADYVDGMLSELAFASDASMAMVSTVAADLGHTTLFGALYSGRTLHLLPAECAFDPDRFASVMRERQVGVLKIVPSHLQALLEAQQAADVLPLHALVLGGEPLPWSLVKRITALAPACRVINHYGPTEATVGVLTFDATAAASAASATLRADAMTGSGVPTGRPLPNVRAYVLDSYGAPVPVGATGELYLGGPGIAWGYLGRPGASAERFVPDASGMPGSRLYRTGDRMRLRADGALDYLGRLDDQVKIRGYRVEPGEISGVLCGLAGVAQAQTVALHEAGRTRLAAFVVLDAAGRAARLDEAALRAQLDERLADYMVPAVLQVREVLPVTVNGKIDRAQLREWGMAFAPVAAAGDAPQPGAESVLAEVWQGVLRTARVGRDDNFFELGGDSILALQVIARARKRGVRFTPKQLFDRPTIAELAAVALCVDAAVSPQQEANSNAAAAGASSAGPLNEKPEVTLTPAQQRFFELNVPRPQHWNQAITLTPVGHFDAAAFAEAFAALLGHHDSFRLRFSRTRPAGQAHPQANSWRAFYAERAYDVLPLAMNEMGETFVDEADALSQFDALQCSFDLERGPLAGAMVAWLAEGQVRIFVALHHLIVDGVSWRVLLDDLESAYRAACERRPVRLAAQGSAAPAWAARLTQAAQQANHDTAAMTPFAGELAWWMRLQGLSATLPCDHPQGAMTIAQGATFEQRFDADLTRVLLTEANAAWRTQTLELLLAALVQALAPAQRQPYPEAEAGEAAPSSPLLLELEGHGREALFDEIDLSRTLGWLTSHYPVALPVCERVTDTLCALKDTLRAVPHKGLGFGVLRYLGDAPTRAALAALPRPCITFNYLGQFEAAREAALLPQFGGVGAERDPAGPLSNALALHAHIDAARTLSVHWVYSTAMFERATIETLMQRFDATLRTLLGACVERVAQHGAGATSGDFPLAAQAGLTQPMLERLPHALRGIDEIYPLSPMQQGLLFHALYAPEQSTYVNQLVATLDTPDIERLSEAFNRRMAQHDILRTSFWHGTALPLQIVHRQATLPLQRLDWRAAADRAQQHDNAESAFAAWLAADRAAGFDLTQAPLMRVTLIQMDEHTWRLVWTRHHLLLDGWSSAQMFAEVLRDYQQDGPRPSSFAAARLHPASAGPRYRDFIAWLAARDTAADEAFWRERLTQFDAPTLIAQREAVALHEPNVRPEGHMTWRAELDAQTTASLVELARRLKLTLNTVIQGAWALLLQRFTHQRSVAFGATVAGRPDALPGIEQVLGLFINTLPVITAPAPHERIADWLMQLQRTHAASTGHAHTPLYEIQRWAQAGGGALFDTLLVFENYPVDAVWSERSERALRLRDVRSIEATDFALTLLVQTGTTLTLDYGFDTARVDLARTQAIQRAFAACLEAFVADPFAALGSVTLTTPSDRAALARFNQTQFDWPQAQQQPLPQQIAQQARATPQAIALQMSCAQGLDGTVHEALSYAELDERVARVAALLRAAGVGAESLVALCVERSLEMVIALLGVMRAGAAYVPVDPDYPAERIAYLLGDARPALVLTQHALFERVREAVPDATLPVICMEDWLSMNAAPAAGSWAGSEADSAADGAAPLAPEQLAYLIYTSGSTGKPKGAGNTHRALANRIAWMQEAYRLRPDDVVLHKTPFGFDVSVWEFVWPLAYGARLAIAAPGDHRDPARLVALIEAQRVTTLHFVPSMLGVFLAYLEDFDATTRCASLTRIISSGEALSTELVARCATLLPQAQLFNLYGPTEAAIDVSHWCCLPASAVPASAASVPIGEPIANLQLHVFDDAGQPLPPGAVGELYLGGVGLARGYLGRPALTAERFVPDPFTSGARLYRTGDRVRRRDDGVLDYLGRIDQQVKLRGQRIEPGEIEALLRAAPGVHDAVVIVRDEQLLGYVACRTPGTLDRAALFAVLRAQLPAYMVPAHLIELAMLPVTPNGKCDRAALPAPSREADEADKADAGMEAAANLPQSGTQAELAAIWQRVLRLEASAVLRRDSDFFALGGHSLLATQVNAQVNLHWSLALPLRLLFDTRTLAQYAAAIDHALEARGAHALDDAASAIDALLGELEAQ
ncbi:non-ribosomal peptide synthetase [Paraburkholderia hayleyella]|uniref:non-ribosomal peptide synthetase n=1 Tax=Paraburkholderia hayleyella TaxID=2152889 RepID=UPI0012910BCC|nr:non-ribosomal peptide synthetase [Paraburkholderia hayleyella]